LYDKFRAVSSIQVILELCIPVLAVMGLQSFFREEDKARQWKDLWQSGAVAMGVIVLLFLCKGMFEFSGIHDEQMRGTEVGNTILELLKHDRKSLYSADLLRSGFLILISFGILWMAFKNKLKETTAVVIIGVVMIGDLFFVDKKYVKNDERTFVSAMHIDQPFQPTQADLHILQDKSHYRVYEVFGRLQARTSFFHKSIGGYSAVRPRRLDQIFEYQIDPKIGEVFKTVDTTNLSLSRSLPVLNMLNIKYLIVQANDGTDIPISNPFAYGNAWFVNDVEYVDSADDEMKMLGTTLLTHTVLVNNRDITAMPKPSPARDTISSIELKPYKPNYIEYQAVNPTGGLAVFSEMHYPKGWNAYIDGEK